MFQLDRLSVIIDHEEAKNVQILRTKPPEDAVQGIIVKESHSLHELCSFWKLKTFSSNYYIISGSKEMLRQWHQEEALLMPFSVLLCSSLSLPLAFTSHLHLIFSLSASHTHFYSTQSLLPAPPRLQFHDHSKQVEAMQQF